MKSLSIFILIIQMISTMFVFPKNKIGSSLEKINDKKENAIVEKVEKTEKGEQEESNKYIIPVIKQEEKAPTEQEKPVEIKVPEEIKQIEQAKPEETQKIPQKTETSENEKVFAIINEERRNAGMKELSYRTDLQNAADTRAKEIVRSFAHTRPDGRSCFTVYAENGINYRSAGENIAYGQRSAAEVMNAWMNSSGHRANILSANYSGVCVGMYEQNGIKYWVQLFIN